jgi:hypothetical protein
MTDFVNLQYEPSGSSTPNSPLVLRENRTIAWVSGIAGIGLRDFEHGLERNPWWASRWSRTNGGNYGAVICRFNYNVNPRLAYCETKDIGRRILDSFTLESALNELPSDGKVCRSAGADIELQVAHAEDDAVESTGRGTGYVECDALDIEMSTATIGAFRFRLDAHAASQLTRGARIQEAYLAWASQDERTGRFDYSISGELSVDSSSLCEPGRADGPRYSLSSRNRTRSTVTWTWQRASEDDWYVTVSPPPSP